MTAIDAIFMNARDQTSKRLDFFERYLSLWVLLCMVLGIGLGQSFPSAVRGLGYLQFGSDSHVNIPIAVLLWLMIYPMMLRIDFGGLKAVLQRPRGIVITLVVNWLVKPLSMAALGWLFLHVIFGRGLGLVTPADAKDAILPGSSSSPPPLAPRWSLSGAT